MKKFNTPDMPFQRWRVLVLAALLALVTGCSTIRFSYNHGDTLLYWWLNTYLDFDSEQADWVKKDIDKLLQWHRKTQLGDYAHLLGNFQRQLANGPTQADLLANYRDIKARGELLAFKALPQLADLARSLKPEQIKQMEKKFRLTNDDFRKKFMSGDIDDQRRTRFKMGLQQLEQWFGRFSSEQEAILHRASDARPLVNDVWLKERILRQQQILALLHRVRQDKLDKEQTMAAIRDLLREFFDREQAPAHKAFFDAYIDSTSKYILTAIKLTTPAQKAHAQQRMQGWIDDFHALAAEAK